MPVADERALSFGMIFAKKVVLTHLRRPLVRSEALPAANGARAGFLTGSTPVALRHRMIGARNEQPAS
jgi:hypothetical protein